MSGEEDVTKFVKNERMKGERRDLDTPSSPHVVVAADRLAITHEAEVHCWADEMAIECKIHATHGEEGSLGNGQDSIDIPRGKGCKVEGLTLK